MRAAMPSVLALVKLTVIGALTYSQVQQLIFNAFNRVNLNNPSLDLNNTATFGRSTSALNPRAFQLGLQIRF